jgi:hypothetical protein
MKTHLILLTAMLVATCADRALGQGNVVVDGTLDTNALGWSFYEREQLLRHQRGQSSWGSDHLRMRSRTVEVPPTGYRAVSFGIIFECLAIEI